MRLLTISRDGGQPYEVISLPYIRDEFFQGASLDVSRIPRIDWSPDGSRILFPAWIDDGRPAGELFAVDADGENFRKVSDDIFASFSPDGSRIVAAAQEPYTRVAEAAQQPNNRPYPPDTVLYTMNPRGEDIRVLVRRNVEGRLEAVNKPPPTPNWFERAWDAAIP